MKWCRVTWWLLRPSQPEEVGFLDWFREECRCTALECGCPEEVGGLTGPGALILLNPRAESDSRRCTLRGQGLQVVYAQALAEQQQGSHPQHLATQ